jgi:hypothetical protein
MVHIIYGLVCRENFIGDEMCRIVKKVENHCSRQTCKCLKFRTLLISNPTFLHIGVRTSAVNAAFAAPDNLCWI